MWSTVINEIKIHMGLQRQRRRKRKEQAEEEGIELLNFIQINCRPKASGLQFCGSLVSWSWPFLNLIDYEDGIIIYKHIEISLLNLTETVTCKGKHFPSSAEVFLKPGVRERNFCRGIVTFCSSEANS